MRVYATLALVSLATMASCHLFLDSRGLSPGSGGAGGVGGGDPTTGGGGIGGAPGGGGEGGSGTGIGGTSTGAEPCHVPLDEACDPIAFSDGGPGIAYGSFSDTLVCEAAGTQGTFDHFGDGPTTMGNWEARTEGDDVHLQHCQNERELTITPNSANDFWYRDAVYDEVGPFVFQRVCHSFAMVTRLTVYGLDAGAEFQGGGIVVADTTDNRKSYIHLSYGNQSGKSGARLYVTPPGQNTVAGMTDDGVVTDPYLGVCRPAGGGLYFYAANPEDAANGNWRPIMPANPADVDALAQTCCVDVGLTAVSFVENPLDCTDPVRGQFDWVEFRGPSAQTTLDLVDDCPAALSELYDDGKSNDLAE